MPKFTPAISYPLGGSLSQIAVADINGDGFQDLVVIDQGDASRVGAGVRILAGDGKGGFPRSFYLPIALGDAVGLGCADLNGDGLTDIAAANPGDGHEDGSILLWINQGGSRMAGPIAIPGGHHPLLLTIADLNLDALLDIVAANRVNGVSTSDPDGDVAVMLGSGEGRFAPPNKAIVGWGVRGIAIRDLNGDALPDLAVIKSSQSGVGDLRTLFGLGDGRFGGVSISHTGLWPSAFAADDLNGDGLIDLAVAARSGDGSLAIQSGNGAGGFADPIALSSQFDVTGSVVVADFNSDGQPDLAVASPGSGFAEAGAGIRVFSGSGGWFTNSLLIAVGARVQTIATGDWNRDGRPDLAAVAPGYGTVVVIVNDTP